MCTAEGRPKSLDSGGFTPLLYAARENCIACVDVLLEARRGHRSAGSRRRLAAARRDHERQLGSGEAADRGRRRRQSVGHLRRGAAVHARSTCATNRRRTRVDRPSRTRRTASTIVQPAARARRRIRTCSCSSSRRTCAAARTTLTRGATPLIRAATNGDLEVVKLLLEHGADATVYMADRQTPIHAVLAGRAPEPQALELIKILARGRHRRERGRAGQSHGRDSRRHGAALRGAQALQGGDQAARVLRHRHERSRTRTASPRSTTRSRAASCRSWRCRRRSTRRKRRCCASSGATVLMPKDPVWPVLGPPQGSGRISRRSASRSFMSRSTSTRAANQHRLERRRLLRAGAATLGAALLPSFVARVSGACGRTRRERRQRRRAKSCRHHHHRSRRARAPASRGLQRARAARRRRRADGRRRAGFERRRARARGARGDARRARRDAGQHALASRSDRRKRNRRPRGRHDLRDREDEALPEPFRVRGFVRSGARAAAAGSEAEQDHARRRLARVRGPEDRLRLPAGGAHGRRSLRPLPAAQRARRGRRRLGREVAAARLAQRRLVRRPRAGARAARRHREARYPRRAGAGPHAHGPRRACISATSTTSCSRR